MLRNRVDQVLRQQGVGRVAPATTTNDGYILSDRGERQVIVQWAENGRFSVHVWGGLEKCADILEAAGFYVIRSGGILAAASGVVPTAHLLVSETEMDHLETEFFMRDA